MVIGRSCTITRKSEGPKCETRFISDNGVKLSSTTNIMWVKFKKNDCLRPVLASFQQEKMINSIKCLLKIRVVSVTLSPIIYCFSTKLTQYCNIFLITRLDIASTLAVNLFSSFLVDPAFQYALVEPSATYTYLNFIIILRIRHLLYTHTLFIARYHSSWQSCDAVFGQ